MQFILPVAACLIFGLQLLLDGREHFYRTLFPVIAMLFYFTSVLVFAGLNRWWILLSVLLYITFAIFYKQLTSGHVRKPWLLPLMFLLALGIQAAFSREMFFAG